MRTTLDLDDDVLAAAKELARQQCVSAGQVVSRLLRQAMTGQGALGSAQPSCAAVAGFQPFESQGIVISNAQIDALRDTEGV
ncbi:MAG: hypothetical protein Fur007_07530 [Rhodoferax sp.]